MGKVGQSQKYFEIRTKSDSQPSQRHGLCRLDLGQLQTAAQSSCQNTQGEELILRYFLTPSRDQVRIHTTTKVPVTTVLLSIYKSVASPVHSYGCTNTECGLLAAQVHSPTSEVRSLESRWVGGTPWFVA